MAKFKQYSRSHLGRWLRDYRRRALRDGREWLLSLDEFKQLVFNPCHYCGAKPRHRRITFYNKSRRTGKWVSLKGITKEKLNGIDRVDNVAGYVAGNCVSCCWQCNAFKTNLSLADFLAHVLRIAKFKGLR